MIIDITETVARSDEAEVWTSQIQQAIDRCHAAGGGLVRFPSGTYVTGTIRLRSHVHLVLEAGCRLLGSTQRGDYPTLPRPQYRSLKDATGFHALIYAEDEENLGLSGAGTI